MTMSKIGLKLANGEFYPVLEEGSVSRKRLVVTTVQDGQRSVQIDIYRGIGPTVAGAEYAGSLVIDNIPSAPKGEPDIRLDLGVDEDGKLSAYAEDLSSGEHQSIELSLEALTEENSYEIPDFSFEEETDSLPSEAGAEAEAADSEDTSSPLASYSGAEIAGPSVFEEKKRKKVLPIILFAILALAVVLGAAWLVYHFLLTPKSSSIEIESESAISAPAPQAPSIPESVQPALPAPEPPPVVQPAPPPPPEPAPAPAVADTKPAKKPGVYYKLRWGDTLWELSTTYYQNPWYFAKIARANKIKNPDHIIAGRKIWIPPR
jgi:nucleoid-associated protein YgaU